LRSTGLLIALGTGALLSAALPPAGLWPLLLALLPLFVLVARSDSPRQAFWLGFTFALGFFSLYILWLPASFSLPEWFGPFFWLVYPPLLLLLGSFWGLVTATARLLGGQGRGALLLLPPLWLLMEWARTQGYFAFPWGALGYAWLDTPVAQLADTIGNYGLSLLTCVLASLLALPFVPAASGSRKGGAGLRSWLPPVLFAALLLGGAWFTGSQKLLRALPQPTHVALLLQPNLDPFGRLGTPEGDLLIQTRLTRQAAAQLPAVPDLVIWPEGAVLGVNLDGAGSAEAIRSITQASPGSTFIVGGRGRTAGSSFNSAFVLEGSVATARYDKFYLVPFGERWPLIEVAEPLYRAVFSLFGMPLLQSTAAGGALVPVSTPHGEAAVYICYESVFPQVAAVQVAQGAELLVTITNDAWFARGNGARQHYDMGRMRAIETRRYLLRSSLNGITGVVDPLGKSVAELARGVPATLVARYSPSDELTPWVRHHGLLVPLLPGWVVLGTAARFMVS
jgi:apolipoprotein N-acyltransferase